MPNLKYLKNTERDKLAKEIINQAEANKITGKMLNPYINMRLAYIHTFINLLTKNQYDYIRLIFLKHFRVDMEAL